MTRGHRLPRLQLRPRPGGRARAGDRAQAGDGLAPGDRASRGRRFHRHPGRFLLRRLSALGRDGGAFAGDARGQGRGGARRARDRHLQRLPGADRGRAAARRADAQCGAQLRLPHVPLAVENSQSLFTSGYDSGRGDRLPGRAPRRQLPGRRGDARPARGRGPGRLPLSRRVQRLGARHRRHPQR